MINTSEIRTTTLFSDRYITLIEFFNKLEKDLEYPNCENVSDRQRVLEKAQRELIMRGKL